MWVNRLISFNILATTNGSLHIEFNFSRWKQNNEKTIQEIQVKLDTKL
jgi:hypothetical protein